VDATLDAFRNLFPEKLQEVWAEYDDAIELILPKNEDYLFGLRGLPDLSTVPAVMVDVDSGGMPEGVQDMAGAWDRESVLVIRFAVEHSNLDDLPRLVMRYLRAGLLVLVDYDNNGLDGLGYTPQAFSDEYRPTLYNEDANLYGRDADLNIQIHSVEG